MSYDLIFITESSLNESVYNSELFCNYYNVLRSDRKFDLIHRSKGGGVLLALAHFITYKVLDTANLSDLIPLVDCLLCRCTIYSQSLVLGVIYIPPDISKNDLDIFLSALETYLINDQFIIIGDFNLPNFISMRTVQSDKASLLHHFNNVLQATQHNPINNTDNRLLDLVLSNTNAEFDIEKSIYPLVPEDSYHPALSINLSFTSVPRIFHFQSARNLRYNFRKADYISLYQSLFNYDWTFLENIVDVNVAVDSFYDALYHMLDTYVPKSSTIRSHHPPWFTSEIIRNLKTKELYRKKWCKTSNSFFLDEFKRLRCLVKTQISNAYKIYLTNIENNIQQSPSDLWKFLSNKRGTSRIPGKLIDCDQEYDDPHDIVNAFAQMFSKVYTPNSVLNLENVYSHCLPFTIPRVNEDELIKIMSSFSNKITAGDDLIPSFFIRDCRFVLAKPLATLINLSLKCSIFPEKWKIARICPVFKKGDRSNLCNYRPISILCNFSKVFERVLYSSIYYNVRSYISPNQHGFMSGRSTVTNLSTITQYLAEVMDKRGQVDVIYTDFSRAFDTINHTILLHKLQRFGLSPNTLKLMSSYLDNRINYVSYNGFNSMEFISISGVPQGSNLGPLLFLLFINDLITSLSCSVLAFADDLKIYSSISSKQDSEHLQRNLNMIAHWCDGNMLKLNVDKCYSISFSRNITPIVSSYTLLHQVLKISSEVKDLGVIFDTKLSFSQHINYVANSASKNLGFIMRSAKYFMNTELLKTLYYSLVLSKLEYASIVWYPIYMCHSLPLDRIHRRFLKYLSFKLDDTYPAVGTDQESLLTRHNMVSLQYRRDINCAKFLVKLIRGVIDCPYLLSKIRFRVPRLAARHGISFDLPTARTNLMLRAPVSVMCRTADRLIDDIFF